MSKIETKKPNIETKKTQLTASNSVNYEAKMDQILKKINQETVEKVMNSLEELDIKSVENRFYDVIMSAGIPEKVIKKSNLFNKINQFFIEITLEKNISNLTFEF
jgi:hypothetical protein